MMYIPLFNKAKKAFTLVELLVTISIVGILAALSVSMFTEYRRKAYDAAAISALKDLSTAIETMDFTLNASGPTAYSFGASFGPNMEANCLTSNASPVINGNTIAACKAAIPAYNHKEKLWVSFSVTYSALNGSANSNGNAAHCLGSSSGDSGFPFAFVYTNGTIVRGSLSMASLEGMCAGVVPPTS